MNKSSIINNSSLIKEDNSKNIVRGECKNCQICQKPFSKVRTKEHKCKRCLRSVCSKCAENKKIVKLDFILKFTIN